MSQDERISHFIRLMNSHQTRLRGLALSLVHHWADAEDVLQEASLVMWAKFDQFEIGTSFFAWAGRIVYLRAADHRRKQGRSKIRFGDEFLDVISARTFELEEELAGRETLLNRCIDKLKPRHRELLRLRYQQGQRAETIAASVGSTAKAVYQALSRIHKALLNCVEHHLAREGGQ